MSKIAVISDTHSNSAALRAVINDLVKRGVERMWMLGDMVGRGVDPRGTLRFLANFKEQQHPHDQQGWLKGNHDTFVTDPNPHPETVVPADTVHMDTYNRHLLQHREGDMIWVREHSTHSQPYPGVYLVHAAYAFDDDGHLDEHATEHLRINDPHNAIAMLDAMHRHLSPKPKLVGFGHTHLTQLWRRTDWGSIERIPIQYGLPIKLDKLDHHTILFNPGSVGFPKEHDPSPTYAVIECADHHFDNISITFHTVAYDPTAMMEAVRGSLPSIYWESINDLVQEKSGNLQEGR